MKKSPIGLIYMPIAHYSANLESNWKCVGNTKCRVVTMALINPYAMGCPGDCAQILPRSCFEIDIPLYLRLMILLSFGYFTE